MASVTRRSSAQSSILFPDSTPEMSFNEDYEDFSFEKSFTERGGGGGNVINNRSFLYVNYIDLNLHEGSREFSFDENDEEEAEQINNNEPILIPQSPSSHSQMSEIEQNSDLDEESLQERVNNENVKNNNEPILIRPFQMNENVQNLDEESLQERVNNENVNYNNEPILIRPFQMNGIAQNQDLDEESLQVEVNNENVDNNETIPISALQLNEIRQNEEAKDNSDNNEPNVSRPLCREEIPIYIAIDKNSKNESNSSSEMLANVNLPSNFLESSSESTPQQEVIPINFPIGPKLNFYIKSYSEFKGLEKSRALKDTFNELKLLTEEQFNQLKQTYPLQFDHNSTLIFNSLKILATLRRGHASNHPHFDNFRNMFFDQALL